MRRHFFCILVVTFSKTRFVQTPLSKNDDESRVDELEKTRDDDDATSFVRISCAPDGVLVDWYHSRGGDGGEYESHQRPVPVDFLSRRANVLRTNNRTGNRARRHFDAIFTRREERSKANGIVGIDRSRGANEADESAGDFSARYVWCWCWCWCSLSSDEEYSH